MTRQLQRAQYILGMQGFALVRRWLRPNMDAEVAELLESTRALARDSAAWPPFEAEDHSVAECYALQQETYDRGWNPLIEVEQAAVWPLLPPAGAGKRALDAACGTGRHAEWLAAHGYTVTGVDASEPMLDVARAKLANGVARRRPAQAESAHPPEAPHVTLAAGQRGQGAHPVELSPPGVDFLAGDLSALPVETAAFDLAVCALALAMCRDIQRPISELAQAVKPGGLVVISDIHPVSVLLGDSLLFETPGGRGVTQQYVRWPGEWIDAFNAAGLRVQRCIDVPWPGPPFGGEWYAPDGELRSPGQLMGDISILAKEGTPAAIVWQLERL